MKIQPQGAVLDIPRVEAQAFLPAGGIPSVDLGPSRQSGKDFVAASLLRSVSRQVGYEERSRTHETHFAAKYVPELRKLIETCRSKEPAESREAFGVRPQFAIGVTGVCHRAEFPESKNPTAQARPWLRKEHGRSKPYTHGERKQQKEGCTQGERQERGYDVECAFHSAIGASMPRSSTEVPSIQSPSV